MKPEEVTEANESGPRKHGYAQHLSDRDVIRVGDIVQCMECNGSGMSFRKEVATMHSFPVLCQACNGKRTQVVREIPEHAADAESSSLVGVLTEGLAKLR
jgi:hypothetical protein